MIDFLLGNTIRKSAQRFIDRMSPKVNIHVPSELSLPSVRLLKQYVPLVTKINELEASISGLSDDQLKAKTDEFRRIYQDRVQEEKKAYLEAKEAHTRMINPQEKEKESYPG